MKISDEMKKSVLNAAGSELPDELLDSICGGRDVNQEESYRLYDCLMANNTSDNGVDAMVFANAIAKYYNYVRSLPEDAPSVMFDVWYAHNQ